MGRLVEIVDELATDPAIQVVVLVSDVPDFFFNHFDLAAAADFPAPEGDDAVPVWTDLVLKLTKAPYITVASIRGLTRGGGNELALALDLRYARLETGLRDSILVSKVRSLRGSQGGSWFMEPPVESGPLYRMAPIAMFATFIGAGAPRHRPPRARGVHRLVSEAAAKADSIGARQIGCLSRGYIALVEGHGDPRSSLRALRVALVEHRAANIPFGLRQFAGDLLHLFAPFQRWSTIAVLDGAAPPVSIFSDAARHAKQAARRELGDAEYDACVTRGRRMLHDGFDSYLSGELDLLGTDQHRPTLPG